jgi:2-succinyl-6-hydroxy-2,4-cyclohexadiene-1-carboxylate synthase
MECVAAPLRSGFRVARLDLIGHGGSDCPDAVDAYRMENCALQILTATERLGLERPHLVGYSMGGRAAIAAAVAAPERFASLVLIGATAGIEDAGLRRARVESDRALADRIEQGGVAAFVDEWMALPIFASQARLGAAALERARVERRTNRAIGLANSLRGMGAGAQTPLFDRLDRFVCPVLLVVGEEDAKFRAIARDLESRFPDARTSVLSRAGHAAHLEAPDAFAEVVSAFLASHARGASRARADEIAERESEGEVGARAASGPEVRT